MVIGEMLGKSYSKISWEPRSLILTLLTIVSCRLDDFITNDRIFREARMSQVTCMIQKRQLAQFNHVARFPESDPVSRMISEIMNLVWRRLSWRPPVI